MACSVLGDINPATRPPVYLVAGSKGGVGKSMLARVAIDQLLLAGKPVLYFESDTNNPDVWMTLLRDAADPSGETIDGVVAYTVRLEEEQSWAEIVTAIDEHPDHTVVIGTASRTSEGVQTHGHILRELLPELQRKLVTLWVIDEQRDSIQLLKEHLTVFPDQETHVVKNSKFGPNSFGLYDGSKVRASIESNGGLSIVMPRLGLGIVTKLYSDRLAISRALEVLPMANRYLLSNFRNSCGKALAPILGT
jgi:hypothetical protein